MRASEMGVVQVRHGSILRRQCTVMKLEECPDISSNSYPVIQMLLGAFSDSYNPKDLPQHNHCRDFGRVK